MNEKLIDLIEEIADEKVSEFVDHLTLLHLKRAQSDPTGRSFFLIINYINIPSIFD